MARTARAATAVTVFRPTGALGRRLVGSGIAQSAPVDRAATNPSLPVLSPTDSAAMNAEIAAREAWWARALEARRYTRVSVRYYVNANAADATGLGWREALVEGTLTGFGVNAAGQRTACVVALAPTETPPIARVAIPLARLIQVHGL